MKVTDAEARLRELVYDVAGLPLEIATALHAAAAGISTGALLEKHATQEDAPLRAANEWASRRDYATGKDLTDIPALDEGIQSIADGVAKVRAALPKP